MSRTTSEIVDTTERLVWVPWAIASAGIALRLQGFLANQPLSMDEAALARNIIDRSWLELLRPLDYAQVAPPGFLVLEKSAVSLFGTSEFALRLYPLLFGIGAVWLCWEVARRVLAGVPAWCAVAFVAAHPLLIDYSVRVKQYSAETAAALLIVLLAVNLPRVPGRRGLRFMMGALGAGTVLVSFTAVFVLTGAAIASVLRAIRERDAGRREHAFIVPAIWMVGALGGVLVGRFSLSPEDASYLQWFWQANFLRMPTQIGDVLWIERRIEELFGGTGGVGMATVWVALAALGAWLLWTRGQWSVMCTLLAPLVLVIGAAALRLYPLSARLQLFLVPLLLLLAAEGLGLGQRLLEHRWQYSAAVPMILAMLLAASLGASRGSEASDGSGVAGLGHIARHWQQGDRVYVHYPAGQEFLYYAPRYGLASADYVIGSCAHGSGRTYLEELDRLRGLRRAWIVMVGYELEPELFTSYLDALGTRVDSVGITNSNEPSYWARTFVRLYDLTETPQSLAVRADRFALPDGLREPAPYGLGCHGVFTPVRSQASR